jgi:hypothetical protein
MKLIECIKAAGNVILGAYNLLGFLGLVATLALFLTLVQFWIMDIPVKYFNGILVGNIILALTVYLITSFIYKRKIRMREKSPGVEEIITISLQR